MTALSTRSDGEVLVDLLRDVERGQLALAFGVDLHPPTLVESQRGIVQDFGMVLQLPADAFSTPLLVAGPGEDDVPAQRHLELLEEQEDLEIQGSIGEIIRRSPAKQVPVLFRQSVRRTRPGLAGGRNDVRVGEQQQWSCRSVALDAGDQVLPAGSEFESLVGDPRGLQAGSAERCGPGLVSRWVFRV